MAQVQSGKKPTDNNATADTGLGHGTTTTPATPTGAATVFGGFGTGGLLRSSTGHLKGLHDKFLAETKESGQFGMYRAELYTNANLPGGQVLLIYLVDGGVAYVSSVFSGDAEWSRSYAKTPGQSGQQDEYGSIRTTPAEVATRILTNEAGARYSPYRRDILSFLQASKILPPAATESSVILLGSFCAYSEQEVNLRTLVGYVDAETRTAYCVRNNMVDTNAEGLLGKLGSALRVDTISSGIARDGLGAPVFAPVILATSRTVQNIYAGSGNKGQATDRLGEMRGYIDLSPLSPEYVNRRRQEIANQTGMPIDQVVAPQLKPTFVITAPEWGSNSINPTTEGFLALLGTLPAIIRNPQWLRCVINAPTNGASSKTYNIKNVGLLVDGKQTAQYHDGTYKTDEMLMGHVKTWWDTMSIAMDMPMTGPFRAVRQALLDRTVLNKVLVNLFGPKAVLVPADVPVGKALGRFPVGIYTDEAGQVRDSRDKTNLLSWLDVQGGSPEAVATWVNQYLMPSGNAEEQLAKRVEVTNAVINSGSFVMRDEVERIALDVRMLKVLATNLANANINVTTRDTQATQTESVGYNGQYGAGLDYQTDVGQAGAGFGSYQGGDLWT